MEHSRPSRFRFRIGTLLLVITILALLIVVVMQQVQLGRQQAEIVTLRRANDAFARQQEQLTTIIRELRGYVERQK